MVGRYNLVILMMIEIQKKYLEKGEHEIPGRSSIKWHKGHKRFHK